VDGHFLDELNPAAPRRDEPAMTDEARLLDPEYCRAEARACEERANEASDFIMEGFWLWLAREWHELANRVEGSPSSFSRLYESIKDLPPKEQESRLREYFGIVGGARPAEGRGRKGKKRRKGKRP
jgi:hypothetical protein